MSLALDPKLPKDLLSNLIIVDIAPYKTTVSADYNEYIKAMAEITSQRLKSRREAEAILTRCEPVRSLVGIQFVFKAYENTRTLKFVRFCSQT